MNRIELYTYLYYACLVLCIFCLAAAAVLFFYYDIKSVIGYLTGRSAKKEIRELEEETAVSGKLAYRKSGFAKKDKKKKVKKSYVMESSGASGDFQPDEETEALPQPEQDACKAVKSTSGRECSVSTNEYTEQDESNQETTVLNQNRNNFIIQREILFIHTDERI